MDVDLSALPHVKQISEAKLLDVTFYHISRFDAYINFIHKACNQRSYLLRRCREQKFIQYAAKHCTRCRLCREST